MSQPPLGSITIENFWGMNLKELTIRRGTLNSEDIQGVKTFHNIADRQVLADAELFVLSLKDNFYWGITIVAATNEVWDSGELLYCQISQNDNWKVTIGVNGQAQTMYVTSPSSGSCNKRMYRIK